MLGIFSANEAWLRLGWILRFPVFRSSITPTDAGRAAAFRADVHHLATEILVAQRTTIQAMVEALLFEIATDCESE